MSSLNEIPGGRLLLACSGGQVSLRQGRGGGFSMSAEVEDPCTLSGSPNL